MEFPLHVLSEYALLADGERGILVGPRGDFAWMCAPRWDSDAVFSTLIGGAGVYAVTPAEPSFVWGGYYEPGTLIWRSRWVTTAQEIECREALGMPGDPHTAVALRRILAIDGDTQVRVFFDPRAGFGQHRPQQVSRRNGVWTARCGPLYLRWSGIPATARRRGAGLHAMITVPDGGHHDLVLEISDRPLKGTPADPGPGLGGDRNGLGAGSARAAWHHRGPRRPPRLRRHARPDQLGRRHGGRGDDEPARAGRGRAQLRLPVRLDPRSVHRGPGGRRGRCLPAARFRGRVRHRADPGRRAAAQAGLHGQRRPGAGRAAAERARLPGQLGQGGQLGQQAVPAGRLRRDADAAGRGGPARPAGSRPLAGRGGDRRGDQGTAPRSRRRDLGTGRASLGAFPADLRGRPAGGRRGRPGGSGRGLERLRRRAARRGHGRLPAPVRPLAAGARR